MEAQRGEVTRLSSCSWDSHPDLFEPLGKSRGLGRGDLQPPALLDAACRCGLPLQ